MSTDKILPHVMAAHCQAIIDALDGAPIPRNAAALLSVEAEPWVTTRDELAEHFSQMGCHVVARRLRKVLVPAEHVVIVVAETDLWIGVIDLRDDEPPPVDAEPEPARGASALGVLGMLGGQR